jgi:hypothetical protein
MSERRRRWLITGLLRGCRRIGLKFTSIAFALIGSTRIPSGISGVLRGPVSQCLRVLGHIAIERFSLGLLSGLIVNAVMMVAEEPKPHW